MFARLFTSPRIRFSRLMVGAILGTAPLHAEPPSAPEFQELIGYTQLKADFPDLPTGRNIAVLVADGVRDTAGAWAVPQGGELQGRTVTYLPAFPSPTRFLDHAMWVTWNLAGATWSQIPDAPTIVSTEIRYYWSDLLNVGTPSPPEVPTWDIENHSWTYTDPTYSVDFVRRADWLIDRYGVLMFAAVGNGTQPLRETPNSFYNGISVGKTNGDHPRGGTLIEGAGRHKPDIVAAGDYSSNTSPKTASSAGLLLDQAKIDARLAAARDPRVIKALLLAGATKTSFPDWTQSAEHPLDEVFGAGELHVGHSYRMLVSGRQVAGDRMVARLGWDAASSGDRRYFFEVPAGHEAEHSAILTWHRTIQPSGDWQTLTPALPNLNLRLARADAEFNIGLVLAESRSSINNVEHIYESRLSAGKYVLQVTGSGAVPYGIAWRSELTNISAPEIAIQPVAQMPALGSTVSLYVGARAENDVSYQWRKNGIPLAGATQPIFTIENFATSDVGDFDVVLENPWGQVTSADAPLQVGTGKQRRLANLSMRTRIGGETGDAILGFVVGGSQERSLLIRGVGPGLQAFGVSDSLSRPELRVFTGANLIASNTDWTMVNADRIRAETGRLGAFALAEEGTDAAFLADFSPGEHTTHLGNHDVGAGIGLIEIYDATLGGNGNLVNLSTRAPGRGGRGCIGHGICADRTGSFHGLVAGGGTRACRFWCAGCTQRTSPGPPCR